LWLATPGNAPWLLVAALSIETEAREVGDWADREHPHGRALVLTGGAAWSQRAAAAFEARWSELGHTSQRFAVAPGKHNEAIGDLKARLGIDPPDLVFAALDVAELRSVRAATGKSVPCYGGGSINPGRGNGAGIPELDGVRILDLPFVVLPDHPAVMVYPRPLNPENVLDMDRLYALGIDAFQLARALALHSGAPTAFDGVSGRLELVREGVDGLRLRRHEAAVVYRDGRFDPVEGTR
jgi:outer membrane PBP1 activator LpoA protein